eukprot:TRINITY_DN83912_c0_g1_i1.p1 TRINITY_DN83912_c0_g1~~TRINITY_DN83912_c0_g1_i1.p1  ORF type:complete len:204 (+),score=71.83 TRINITY_DN83912_c0_g1_i1:107-718(+)
MLSTKRIVTACMLLATSTDAVFHMSSSPRRRNRGVVHDMPDYSAPKSPAMKDSPPPPVAAPVSKKDNKKVEKKTEKKVEKKVEKTGKDASKVKSKPAPAPVKPAPTTVKPMKDFNDYVKDDAPGKVPVAGVKSDGGKPGEKKGKPVEHADGATYTSDWRQEVPEYKRPTTTKAPPPPPKRSGASSMKKMALPAAVAFLFSITA